MMSSNVVVCVDTMKYRMLVNQVGENDTYFKFLRKIAPWDGVPLVKLI